MSLLKHIVDLQALAGATDRIKTLISGLPSEALRWNPGDGTWCIKSVVTHLLHSEILFRKRLEQIVAEDMPSLKAFGPDEATPFSDKPFDELLIAFQAARQETLSLLYSLTLEDWQRSAIHATQGSSTLREQVQNIINHDTLHIGQIVDIRETWISCNEREEDENVP